MWASSSPLRHCVAAFPCSLWAALPALRLGVHAALLAEQLREQEGSGRGSFPEPGRAEKAMGKVGLCARCNTLPISAQPLGSDHCPSLPPDCGCMEGSLPQGPSHDPQLLPPALTRPLAWAPAWWSVLMSGLA